MLGDLYTMFYKFYNATHHDWPCRRNRFWGCLLHRSYITRTYSELSNVIDLFYRFSTLTYHEMMQASKEEQEQELLWSINRPKSRCKGKALDVVLKMPKPWVQSLTEKEAGNLMDYEAKYPKVDGQKGWCFALA